MEIIGPLGFLPSSSKSTFPRNSKALLFGRSPSLRLLCSNLLKEEGEEKKNRLGDALCLNIWPVDEHFEWLVCSVSLQVLGEGDSSIVGRHKWSCACQPPGNFFKSHPLRKSNSGSVGGGGRKFVQIHLAEVQTSKRLQQISAFMPFTADSSDGLMWAFSFTPQMVVLLLKIKNESRCQIVGL